jgi:hypothetical protein
LRKHLRGFQDSGVDQVSFIQQGGRNKHEHICEALELFAKEVMPEFKASEAARKKKKDEELAPFVEKALARKARMKPLKDEDIPRVVALGRQIAEQARAAGEPAPTPPAGGIGEQIRRNAPADEKA